MSAQDEQQTVEEPPDWAVERASAELYDGHDPAALLARAREIARDAAEREVERHDEYDDPDQGGEG